MPTRLGQRAPVSAARPAWGKWVAIGLAAALVLFVVGLFALRAKARDEIVKALGREVGPADRWEAKVGLFAPLGVLLGQGVDLDLHGRGIRPRNAPMLSELTVKVRDIVVSLAGPTVRSCRSATFDMFWAEDAVADFLQKETAAGHLQNVRCAFEAGQIVITGETDLGLGRIPVPGLQVGAMELTARSVPRIEPPAALALDLRDVSVRMPAALGGQERTLGSTERAALGLLDFRYDISRLIPGVTLQNVVVSDSGVRITGSLDPVRLLR